MFETNRPDVLVAVKKSRWEHHLDAIGEVTSEGDPAESEAAAELEASHSVHRAGIDSVVEHLESTGLSYRVAYRGDIDETSSFDLVVTVGGDGTVLDMSHKVRDVPILALNSHPESSVGYFCAGATDAFPDLLDRCLDGGLPSFELLRFRIRIDGDLTGPPVLNEILISHENPAAVSQYVLETGAQRREEQHSSGIWVSTPAGSTAAVRSAGGEVLPFGCECIEYVVREPYPLPGEPYRVRKGIQPVEDPFRVQSRMERGRVFIDGPHISRTLDFERVVSIDPNASDLTLYGLDVDRKQSLRRT